MWNGSIQLGIQKEIQQNENGFEKKTYNFSEEIPAEIADTTRNE